MAPKIFITGATGYLGGDVLHHLLSTYPSWESEITCLVRSPSRSSTLSNSYPALTIVSGTLSDSQIIQEEAAKADIVLNFASSNDVGAVEAIKTGMEKGNGGYWIHTSGTDILLNPELLAGKRDDPKGKEEVKVYDDWDNIREVLSFPDAHSHRPCDKVPLSTSGNVKTVVVCPPTIFGKGRGTGNTRSHQIYELARLTLERGKGILIPSSGKTFWPNVHVHDLSRLYLSLVDSAAAELEGKVGKATWGGKQGYYFAESGVHYWQDITSSIAEEAHKQGFLESPEVAKLRAGEEEILVSAGPALWNLRASCKAIRAKKLFGWEPQENELKDEIKEIVRSEAGRAGIV